MHCDVYKVVATSCTKVFFVFTVLYIQAHACFFSPFVPILSVVNHQLFVAASPMLSRVEIRLQHKLLRFLGSQRSLNSA